MDGVREETAEMDRATLEKAWKTICSTFNIIVAQVAGANPRVSHHPPPSEMVRVFVLVKPDGVQRGLVDTVLERIGKTLGVPPVLRFVRDVHLEKAFRLHYREHAEKPGFNDLVAAMSSQGPVHCAVFRSKHADAITRARIQMHSLRKNYAPLDPVHVSDSEAAAKHEEAVWFGVGDHVTYTRYTPFIIGDHNKATMSGGSVGVVGDHNQIALTGDHRGTIVEVEGDFNQIKGANCVASLSGKNNTVELDPKPLGLFQSTFAPR